MSLAEGKFKLKKYFIKIKLAVVNITIIIMGKIFDWLKINFSLGKIVVT